jgi:hypothetical protein
MVQEAHRHGGPAGRAFLVTKSQGGSLPPSTALQDPKAHLYLQKWWPWGSQRGFMGNRCHQSAGRSQCNHIDKADTLICAL